MKLNSIIIPFVFIKNKGEPYYLIIAGGWAIGPFATKEQGDIYLNNYIDILECIVVERSDGRITENSIIGVFGNPWVEGPNGAVLKKDLRVWRKFTSSSYTQSAEDYRQTLRRWGVEITTLGFKILQLLIFLAIIRKPKEVAVIATSPAELSFSHDTLYEELLEALSEHDLCPLNNVHLGIIRDGYTDQSEGESMLAMLEPEESLFVAILRSRNIPPVSIKERQLRELESQIPDLLETWAKMPDRLIPSVEHHLVTTGSCHLALDQLLICIA